MRRHEQLVVDDMRVALERTRVVRSNEPYARRVSSAVRSNCVRLHIEEPRVRAFRADVAEARHRCDVW